MTKSLTKKAARSTQTPGAPNSNPSGLPYGTGSIQIRGNVWWMIFRDPEGRIVQENTRTEDQAQARRLLATRALETLRAKMAVLEAILNEEEVPAGINAGRQDLGSGAGAGSRKSGRRSGAAPAKSGRKAKAGKGTK